MPTYQYECKGCGSSWEETHKIAEREKPLKVPCRVCFDEIRLIPQYQLWYQCKVHGEVILLMGGKTA